MRNKRTGEDELPMAEIERRVLARLEVGPPITHACMLGMAIWPNNSMTNQGLGGVTSRIIKAMAARNLVKWVYRPGRGDGWFQLVKL